jgi:hypothetical protein
MSCQGPFTDDIEKLAQEAVEITMELLEKKYRIIPKDDRRKSMFKEMFSHGEQKLREALEELLTADRYDGF